MQYPTGFRQGNKNRPLNGRQDHNQQADDRNGMDKKFTPRDRQNKDSGRRRKHYASMATSHSAKAVRVSTSAGDSDDSDSDNAVPVFYLYGKRPSVDSDIYAGMHELVDDIDNDELYDGSAVCTPLCKRAWRGRGRSRRAGNNIGE